MINKDRLQAALKYLSKTDEPCAQARADHARAEFKAKSIKNAQFQAGDGSIADRNAVAETSEAYCTAKLVEFESFFEYEKLKNKRATEAIVIDTWRSLNAGRRTGQIM